MVTNQLADRIHESDAKMQFPCWRDGGLSSGHAGRWDVHDANTKTPGSEQLEFNTLIEKQEKTGTIRST